MTSWSLVFGVVCLVVAAAGFPSESHESLSRMRRSPLNGMMVRGYFLRTPTYNTYYPRAAYGGGMAGVGSYYAPRRSCRNCNQLEEDLPMAVPEPEAESDPRDEAPESVPVEDVTAVSLPEGDREDERKPEVEVPKEEEEEVPTAAPKPKSPKKPRTPKRRPIDVDNDEDEEEEAPRKAGRKGGDSPSYANFFPTYFGGGSRRRSGQDEDEGQNPGLVAIANSFSTGRGAIATSSATAFGGPAPAPATSRGSPSRYRS